MAEVIALPVSQKSIANDTFQDKLARFENRGDPLLWYKNEDGSLKCFGRAIEFRDNVSFFHCGQLNDHGDCNEALRRECWKRSMP